MKHTHETFWVVDEDQDTSGAYLDYGTKSPSMKHNTTIALKTLELRIEGDMSSAYSSVRYFEAK